MTIGTKILLIFVIFNIFAWPLCFFIGGDFGSMCIVVVPMWNIAPFLISILLVAHEIMKKKLEEKKLRKTKLWIALIITVILLSYFLYRMYYLNYLDNL